MIRIQKTVVVVGCGEIGKPLYQLSCGGYEQVLAVDLILPEPEEPQYPVEALHICIPGSLPDFNRIVETYVQYYEPELLLIHSSSLPGMTDKLAEHFGLDRVVHSQVHGKHHGDRMRRDMLRHPKFVATRSDLAFEKAKKIFVAIGHAPEDIRRLSSPLAGEIVKLLATTYFGYLLAWTQEVERLSDKMNLSFDELMTFTILDTPDFDICGKYPGIIGGHCVMQNIEILQQCFPSAMWDMIQKSNDLKTEREKNAI